MKPTDSKSSVQSMVDAPTMIRLLATWKFCIHVAYNGDVVSEVLLQNKDCTNKDKQLQLNEQLFLTFTPAVAPPNL